MSAIFVSHRYSFDPKRNRLRVARIARSLALHGHLPLAPQLLFPHFVDERTERDLAMRLCFELIALADEVRAYGTVSEGMRLEIAHAKRLGIPVIEEKDQGSR